ncbi:MAG: hypothetical protein WEB56_05400 [Roseovarius sp.]
MTYYQTFTTLPCSKLDLVREFLREHGAALAKAVENLGGPAASARVFLLCEALRDARRLTRAQTSQLVGFHRLLTLKHVGDPDRIESALFAQIDPSSAFVDTCCFLSERLDALLRLIAENNFNSAACCEASLRTPNPN